MTSTAREPRPPKVPRNGHVKQAREVRASLHNHEAERALLAGVLLDPSSGLHQVGDLGTADFHDEAHREVYAAMLALDADGLRVELPALLERLPLARHDLVRELDLDVSPAANLSFYAKAIRDKAQLRREGELRDWLAGVARDHQGSTAELIAKCRAQFDAAAPAAKKSASLRDHRIALSRASIRSSPPKRRFMLHDAGTGAGVYVQGKVGLLAAPGGTGKSWTLAQLAVCVATGRTWFGSGGWAPAEPGRVLLLMAEEDPEEVARQLHFAAKASGILSDEELELMSRNVDAFGLSGFGVALTVKDAGATAALPETTFAQALREIVGDAAKEGRPYTLILLDPLSRFAGPDVEKDSSAATRWVQVLETLTAPSFGSPSVIVSCHTAKRKGDDDDPRSADMIRGTSALKDAVRWAARLEQQERNEGTADLLTLRLVKANGIPPQLGPLVLCRDKDNEGALRLATRDEIDSHEGVSAMVKSKLQQLGDHQERILAAMRPGQTYSRRQLTKICGGKKTLILEAVRKLLLAGEIEEPRSSVLMLSTDQGTGPGTGGAKGPDQPGLPLHTPLKGVEAEPAGPVAPAGSPQGGA